MPIVKPEIFELAVKNIAQFGDTDIFPYPIENHIFKDLSKEAVKILEEIDKNFEESIKSIPILTAKNLSVVGYSGFRWGTQIDPIWNAYLLALVISIAEEIENKRVGQQIVFSYRFNPDKSTGSLFDKNIGWQTFQSTSLEHAQNYPYALRCDISDFYPRIYHHRLENALKKATNNGDIINRIMIILQSISDNVSYGLPVGGPAARILSELLLNRVDRLLLSESVTFCRFVDDFVIFAESKEKAYSSLISLTDLLLTNEGLALQKTKTRIMTSKEFLSTSEFSPPEENENASDTEERAFRRLRVYYDPYSLTAESDYEALKRELAKFDVVGMLGRELTKSRIDEGLSRRLISALKHLQPAVQNDAIRSIVNNLDLLYPIFPSVMLLCRGLLQNLEPSVQNELFERLRTLISSNSYITQVPTNLAYALRVLASDASEETEILISALYKQPLNMMIKRDIILMMAHRGADHWISNCRKSYSTLTGWERRAMLISSYILEDEGRHWRESVRNDLNPFDKLIIKWAAESKQRAQKNWKVPV
ncbi:RNA-directed DNA polymerase [Pseudomonas sp. zfem005]|uniref:RNA-directed DNA polymerase n=1 Tax=Pseudomonas sp. zfem005 TaxID=3078200 RepID=UPI0029296DB2|nr:RNA-directed DNA polymerase [Pseudomonas sp. zfem005]MDU9415142.1 RNA-directed DNA polymerase [Pseudomonas sp. zfem005]